MRLILFILALSFASHASAQNPPTIAGFHLGMSVQEARAVAPGPFRRDMDQLSLFSVTQRSQFFGDVAFPLHLIFVNGVLDYAGGASALFLPSSEMCLSRHQALVENLEITIGPIAGAQSERGANDRMCDLEPVHTSGGSYIHRYSVDERVGAVATMSGPFEVEVRASASQGRDGLWHCSTMYSFSSSAPMPESLPQSTIENWAWATRPPSMDFVRSYPSRALEVGRPGDVTLICSVVADGAVNCTVGHESPVGWGFGEAALRISHAYRIASHTADGLPTAGATVRVPIRFRSAP